MTFPDWYLHVRVNAPVTEGQAAVISAATAAVAVDTGRGATDVCWYVAAPTLPEAAHHGIEQVRAALAAAGVTADLIAVQIKTEAELIADLNTGQQLPELVGVAEVRTLLGIRTRQQVHQMGRTGRLPAPVAELRCGRVWDRAVIMAFAARWKRREEGGGGPSA